MAMPKWLLFVCAVIAGVVISSKLWAADQEQGPFQTISGRMEVMVADDFKTGTSEIHYAVRVEQADGNWRLHPLDFGSDAPAEDLRTGNSVAVRGRFSGNTLQVEALERIVQPQGSREEKPGLTDAPAAGTLLLRRAVVLVLNFNDAQNQLSVEDVAGLMYTDEQNVDGLFRASSFQQLGFDRDGDGDGNIDVFGPFNIDMNATDSCDYNVWAGAANRAAQDAEIDLSIYHNRVYALPAQAACEWWGLANIYCLPDCFAFIKEGGGPVYAHELGHNLGWYHSATDPENDGILNEEYGDWSGIMGRAYWAQANAPHRDQRGWFDAYPGTLVSTNISGTYELDALEFDPGVDTVGTQVLKIPKGDTVVNYYLSYRRRISTYPSLPAYADLVNVHSYGHGPFNTTLHIVNLGNGDSFTDAANGITVTVTALDGPRATVEVIQPNRPPTALFTISAEGMAVEYTDASSDADGTIEIHQWDFGDGQSSAEVNPIHTYAAAGTYTIILTVTDDDGDSDTLAASVTVPANFSPVADFTYAVDGRQVRFTDTSSDRDGTVVRYRWTFEGNKISTLRNPTYTFAAPGTYPVTLRVTDDDGKSGTITKSVTIWVPNAAPNADFAYAANGLQVQFTDASSDSDGTIAAYQWDFGDGQGSTDTSPIHTYAAAGTYNVTLTVIDDDGANTAVIKGVAVSAPNAAPSAGFTLSVDGLQAQFTDASNDSDGTIAAYQWNFGDGDVSSEQNPEHIYDTAGDYLVRLTVRDDDGAEAFYEETLSVQADPSPGGGGGGGCFIGGLIHLPMVAGK